VPKVSEHHREQRRRQILDGARSCFAQHGYERTTVRELEAAIGLSSGAIFSYYPSKLDLFIALAAEDAELSARMWTEGGLSGLVRNMQARSDELSASYLELGRRIWADPEFREKWFKRGEPLMAAIENGIRAAVASGQVRDDIPVDALVDFATVVLDGLMFRIRIGLLPDRLTSVLSMYEEAMRGPAGP
jgi:AcrR family transcriptional regulator